MHYMDDWHDYVRVVALLVCLYSLVTLFSRRRKNGADWNVKTNDYWFALLMWTLAGCVFAIQGIYLDRPFTPGFVFLTAASLVTGKGLNHKGDWGGSDK